MKNKLFLFVRILLIEIMFHNISSCLLYAQTNVDKHIDMFHNWSKLLSPEKVYLHTDKDVYFATDTIWFSGYVENASYASEFDESNYIYVELITDRMNRDFVSWNNYAVSEPEILSRVKLKCSNNSFQGHIAVPEMNSTGRAIIRAYTYWMLNRPAEYMFYKELEITNPMKDKLLNAMEQKKVKKKSEYLRLGAESPFGKKDEEEERYDVQFLPESGNYTVGSDAVVYIKSIGRGGAGVKVFGDIVDSGDRVVAKYSTDSMGFGRVIIDSLPVSKLYATVNDNFGYKGKNVKLPVAVNSGVSINGFLTVEGKTGFGVSDNITFEVRSSDVLHQKQLKLFLHNGTEVYYSKMLGKPVETASFNLNSLMPGIHSVSVIDVQGNVYAERPFMVLPTVKEAMELYTHKQEYRKRELVNLKMHLPKELLGEGANFSVAITDMGIIDNMEKTTMQSYMLLKSELRGYIENLDWYFNDTIPLSERMLRADMLMQTQGWRYYDIEKIVQGKTEQPYFGREYKQTLFGKVVNPIGLTKKATVSFLAPSINFRAMGQIDSGYFVLKDVDFPVNTRFIISAVGKNGRSTSHMPVLQDDYYAPIFQYPEKVSKVTYTQKYSNVVESIYYNLDDGDHAMAFELNPIVVTSQLITPKNSPSPIPNYPIRKDWYRDTMDIKPYLKHYDLVSYITTNFPGIRVSTQHEGIAPKLIGRNNSPYRVGMGTAREVPVQIYMNGLFMDGGEFARLYLFDLPLSEVESLICVSGLSAAPFQSPNTLGTAFPAPVLMIRTKPFKRADEVPYNVTSAYPLGWQKPVKFYSPRYDTPEGLKKKGADNRITLYWNPAVKLDENGEATISFYTSDSDSNYRVEVEGRSAARQYHYAEKIIERVKESAPAKKK